MNDVDRLASVDVNNVSDVPRKNELVAGKVAKVIDGDTLKVVLMMGNYPFMVSVRILGVDCPESMKNKAKCELEQKAGCAVKLHVKDLIRTGDIVMVILTKKDMYCRYDGDVHFMVGCEYTPLKDYLLDNGLAKHYEGKKKEEWTCEELEHIISYCSHH